MLTSVNKLSVAFFNLFFDALFYLKLFFKTSGSAASMHQINIKRYI